jgi:hypothetical protein
VLGLPRRALLLPRVQRGGLEGGCAARSRLLRRQRQMPRRHQPLSRPISLSWNPHAFISCFAPSAKCT